MTGLSLYSFYILMSCRIFYMIKVMFKEKIKEIISKFNEVEQKLGDSGIIANQEEYKNLSKEHSYLSPIV